MTNSIALFKQYIDLLDEVYRLESKTSMFDIDSKLVQAGANANQIVIPKISMDGLADYSRNSGYVSGDVTLTMETVEFNYDRGRKFTVDAMDNAETAGVAFGSLAAQFIRDKVVPELDAFRIATYASDPGIGGAVGSISSGTAAIAALRTATSSMDEAEVPENGRVLFITPSIYGMIEDLDTNKSREVMGRFDTVVRMPQARFYTAIDLYDGTSSGETAGGYIKDATNGKDINFMIIEKSAVIQYAKHTVSKVIAPEDNQSADGWAFAYRAYNLCDVYENKTAGIYLHRKS